MLNLKNFTDSKDNGLNYELEDQGRNIYWGQIQRIGIARALYHDLKILFLDEFSSSLDEETETETETETEILNTLARLKHNYTIFAISHKKNIINYSDEIYKLEDKCFKKL